MDSVSSVVVRVEGLCGQTYLRNIVVRFLRIPSKRARTAERQAVSSNLVTKPDDQSGSVENFPTTRRWLPILPHSNMRPTR